jgi:DNA ligase-1
MRAATLERGHLEALRYPLLASPKYDGVRCVVIGGELYSRKLKLIPNRALQRAFGRRELNWCEGELVSGSPNAPDCIGRTMSQVMTREASAAGVLLFLYDFAHEGARHLEYRARRAQLQRGPGVRVIKQRRVDTAREVLAFEKYVVSQGYEGIMLRCPTSPYKCGDATLREQHLMKYKRFVDAEAVVLAVHEEMENKNEQTRDERGYAKRSTHKANKVGKGRVGGFRVRDLKTKKVFRCAPGKLTAKERVSLWSIRMALVRRVLTYRYQPVGVKEKPRFPRFRNWRDRKDVL